MITLSMAAVERFRENVEMTEHLRAFVEGIGSIFDLVPVRRKLEIPAVDPMTRDTQALRRDWERIGRDFYVTIESMGKSERRAWHEIVEDKPKHSSPALRRDAAECL